MRICKRLEIDFAEAVVGFEFGHRMAVPVIQGVVIAQEHYEHLIEELEKYEAERARKEDEKRRRAALTTWRRFLMGLRIAERIQQDYGHLDDEVADVTGHGHEGQVITEANTQYEDMGGGFLPEGFEEEAAETQEPRQTSNFFAAPDPHDDDDEGEDPFQVEYHHAKDTTSAQAQGAGSGVETGSEAETEPEASAVILKKATPKRRSQPVRSARRRTRRKQVESSNESEDGVDEDFQASDNDD